MVSQPRTVSINLGQVHLALAYITGDAGNVSRWAFPVDRALLLSQEALVTVVADKAEGWIIRLISQNLKTLKNLRKGTLAENLKFRDTSGNVHSLSDYRGKVVLLHYWGTWCGNCLDGLHTMLIFERSHVNDTNFVCLDVALEIRGFANWKHFVREHDLRYAVELYADNEQIHSPSVATGFQWVTGVPTFVLLNRSGCLVCPFEAAPPNKKLEDDIERAERD